MNVTRCLKPYYLGLCLLFFLSGFKVEAQNTTSISFESREVPVEFFDFDDLNRQIDAERYSTRTKLYTEPILIKRKYDSNSPILIQKFFSGAGISKLTIEYKSGSRVMKEVNLENVRVVGFSNDSNSGSETIKLFADRIRSINHSTRVEKTWRNY